MPPRHESSVVFPQPLGPSRMTSVAGGDVEVEAVDRAHRVAAARVLDDEVVDVQVRARSGTSERERGIDGHRAAQARDARGEADRRSR